MCVGGECSHLGLAGPVEEALGGKEGGERNKSKFLWEISLKSSSPSILLHVESGKIFLQWIMDFP